MSEQAWALKQAARQKALEIGEDIAGLFAHEGLPIDPLRVVEAEAGRILARGLDAGDSFDGRISFHGSRFLLLYNTRYNRWWHRGSNHPKVRFTIAHELGHYFLDRHRAYLMRRHASIESFTEFESAYEVERQADAFASGLLTPARLVSPRINHVDDATVADVKRVAEEFDVSLTGMMVRWTQLSHYPCATLCVRDQRIQWGFVSGLFRESGFWKARRGEALEGRDARAFSAAEPSFEDFREGEGTGLASNWLEGARDDVNVREFYVVMPYSRCMLVFLTADENDLSCD